MPRSVDRCDAAIHSCRFPLVAGAVQETCVPSLSPLEISLEAMSPSPAWAADPLAWYPVDWDTFEAAWHDVGCRALVDLAAAHPGERPYAAAFHLFYSDGQKILPPALAVNIETAVRHDHGYSTRFAPSEWRWDILDAASEAMQPWYRRITEEFYPLARAAAERDAGSGALEAAHDAAMARVCTLSVRVS
jgi:hypothetical protein